MEHEVRAREWLVLFTQGSGFGWWSRWLRPGCRHVSLLAYWAEHRLWVRADFAWNTLVIVPIDAAEAGARILDARRHGGCYRFTNRGDAVAAYVTPASCVQMVKQTLGLPGWYVTPAGLRAALVRAGAAPL